MFMLLNVYCHAYKTRINKDFVQEFLAIEVKKSEKFEHSCIINDDLFIFIYAKEEKGKSRCAACRIVKYFLINLVKCASDVIR